MEIFTSENKMAHIVRQNCHLLPVINRFGIRLGFRDKTIAAVCDEYDIHAEFFLAIVNTFHNEKYFPEKELLLFSPVLIINYLKKTHVYYVDYVLPKLESLLRQLLQSSHEKKMELQMIGLFYKKYKEELLRHIGDEEENVFPYVLGLAINNHAETNYRIHSFEKEHTNVDNKLNDLTSLVIKYMEPVYDENVCNDFLVTLFGFEKDIKDHARIEDKILVQQVRMIESRLQR
jgi:regulator of cell morphogenesis and NO signaling